MSADVTQQRLDAANNFLATLESRSGVGLSPGNSRDTVLAEMLDECWLISRQTDPKADVRKLLLALVEANVLSGLEADGTLIVLEALEKILDTGWVFIPPMATTS